MLHYFTSLFQRKNLQFSNMNFEWCLITLKYSNSSAFIVLEMMIGLLLFYQYMYFFLRMRI